MRAPYCILDIGQASRRLVITKLLRMACPLTVGACVTHLQYQTLKGSVRTVAVEQLSEHERRALAHWIDHAPRAAQPSAQESQTPAPRVAKQPPYAPPIL